MTNRRTSTAIDYRGVPRVRCAARCLTAAATAIVLVLAVAGAPALGLPGTGSGPAGDAPTSATNETDSDDVTVGIDCDASQARVTAPEDYEYGLTVSAVNVTRSGTGTSSSSRAPLSGSATTEFGGTEVVYAFVTDESTRETITAASEQCGELPGANETSETNATAGPSIAIDCNESVVRFVAPEDVSYTGKVTSVDVSPTGSSTSSVSGTADGDTIVPTEGGLIIAFASSESADEPVSAVRDCSRIDRDEPSPAEDSCSSRGNGS